MLNLTNKYNLIGALSASFLPLLLALLVYKIWLVDISIPLVYSLHDDVWQYVLTKAAIENGWIFENKFLGAPGVANWSYHVAAQSSALHSIFLIFLSSFFSDAIATQQLYYFLNFSIIGLLTFYCARVWGVNIFFAVLLACLFPFTNFRINSVFFSFLNNYFSIPLVFILVGWVVNRWIFEPSSVRLSRRYIALGIAIAVVIACSDGYYAFFGLLMLGFAWFISVLNDRGNIKAFTIYTCLMVATIIGVSSLLLLPTQLYKWSHKDEFYPNGVIDSSLIKHPFEAEVYSSSLKLLLAPIPNHRVKAFGKFGSKLIKSSDDARKFPVQKPSVSLGLLCSVGMLLTFAWLLFRRNRPLFGPQALERLDSLSSLSLFAFLCSISGGIGTLVAWVFPSIRAYDRFPLFLILVILLWMGVLLTALYKKFRQNRRSIQVVAILVSVLAFLDSVPGDAQKTDSALAKRYVGERTLVRQIESSVPKDAMIYQYPFSQYLTNNEFYGWGAFAQLRAYLHSQSLRWSNGASKNSPEDKLHQSWAGLPLANLVQTLVQHGFAGILVDGFILGEERYADVTKQLTALTGHEPEFVNVDARWSYWRLESAGFKVVLDKKSRPAAVHVTSPDIKKEYLPEFIRGSELERLGTGYFDLATSNSLFRDLNLFEGLRGLAKLDFVNNRQIASLSCRIEENGSISVHVTNETELPIYFGIGKYPILLGFHLYDRKGKLLNWDDGTRYGTGEKLSAGSSMTLVLKFPKDLNIEKGEVVFELVQDGNSWFGANPANKSCTVKGK